MVCMIQCLILVQSLSGSGCSKNYDNKTTTAQKKAKRNQPITKSLQMRITPGAQHTHTHLLVKIWYTSRIYTHLLQNMLHICLEASALVDFFLFYFVSYFLCYFSDSTLHRWLRKPLSWCTPPPTHVHYRLHLSPETAASCSHSRPVQPKRHSGVSIWCFQKPNCQHLASLRFLIMHFAFQFGVEFTNILLLLLLMFTWMLRRNWWLGTRSWRNRRVPLWPSAEYSCTLQTKITQVHSRLLAFCRHFFISYSCAEFAF